MNKLSSNLVFLLKKYDTTQSELALYVNVSQNSISNWINEVLSPNVEAMIKIYQFFGISLDALIFIDLKNSKIVTNEHIEEFKRNGKVSGKISGKIEPVSKQYFLDNEVVKNNINEPDPVALYMITGQFKNINEKLDQLRVLGEEILKKGSK